MVKKNNKENERQVARIIWATLILILVFFASYLLFKNIGTIEVQGLTFVKERFGEINVYHYYYVYQDKNQQLVQNNIYLRENPEKNSIPVNGDEIQYVSGKFTYVSINATAMEGCRNSNIALSELSSFLVNGGLNVRGGVLNNETEFTNTTRYVTCQTDPNNPVIQINAGNKSKIEVNGLCSNIQFSSCDDVLPAVEKFIVQSIVDARKNTIEELT